MPYYLNQNIDGLIEAGANGDGASANLRWATAYPNTAGLSIAYNIYYTTTKPTFTTEVFANPPIFISYNGATTATIENLEAGQMYWFAVRAAEYSKENYDFSKFPQINGLATYPQSLLRANVGLTDTIIPLIDAESFPQTGIIRLGTELIYYTSVDYANNNLLVPGGSTQAAHLIDLTGHGNYYLPNVDNVGTGTINNLTLSGLNPPTETWTIKCIFTEQGMPTVAKFVAIGSVSGLVLDGYGNPYVWTADGYTTNNGILSFSITNTTPFALGDSFEAEVQGVSHDQSGRGYNGSQIRIHNTDGYDGYYIENPNAIYWVNEVEEQNTRVYETWVRFDIGNEPFNIVDGYHQRTSDILTTDLSYSDQVNDRFPAYDFAGWHRTDPVLLLNGTCVGSYIGGYQWCADGYGGVGQQIRGLNIQQMNLQRQEVLLTTDGEPVVLLRRSWTGITNEYYLPYNEYPENRGVGNYGTPFVVGYQQIKNDRRSDGRFLFRIDPSVDDLPATDSGLESSLNANGWTLGFVTVKDRDIIVRFDENDVEEFRYEILNVTRNRLLLNQTGAQKFSMVRIRKTDPIYQIPVFVDESLYPNITATSTVAVAGALPPHSHSIIINEKGYYPGAQQLTSVAAGHNHPLVLDNNGNLVVMPVLGHTHLLI